MKKTSLLLFVLFMAIGAKAQWQSNGPDSAVVECLAANGTSVFAGTAHRGIYLSIDNGSSWMPVDSGLPYTGFNYVSSLAISNSNVYAGTVGGGIFLSNNNGISWGAVNNGLGSKIVYSLGVMGTSIFAGTAGGVYVSADSGNSWTLANTGLSGNVGSFTSNGKTIFAGTPDSVYLSTDTGGKWTAALDTNLTGTPIYALGFNDTILYAGAYSGGVFLSHNNGGSWTQIDLNLPIVGYLSSIAFFNDTNIFVSDYGSGVYLNTTANIKNGSSAWMAAGTGLDNGGVSSLAVSGGYIFAGTGGSGVWQLPLASVIPSDIQEIPATTGSFSLYPNPNSSGNVELLLTQELPNSKIDMHDITGRIVLSQIIETKKTNIDISTLAAGMYTVTLETENGVSTQKLVIAK